MAIYNGERLKVGYNRTPTKFYKNYADRIKKVEEFRILQDTYKSEMCNVTYPPIIGGHAATSGGLPLRKKSRGVWQGDSSP